MAEQSVAITMTCHNGRDDNIVTLTCTTATGGTVTAAILATYEAQETALNSPAILKGYIRRVAINPGSTAPSDNWAFTLTDSDGVDVLAGMGISNDTANSSQIIPARNVWIDGEATLNVTGAGDAKTFTLTIYITLN